MDNNPPEVTRRQFGELAVLVGLGTLLPPLPDLDLNNGRLLETTKYFLKLSEAKAGIIDIMNRSGVVNNLVPLIKWSERGRINHNNSEIQGITPEVVRRDDGVKLVFAFDQFEVKPQKNVPSGLVVAYDMTHGKANNEVVITPQILENPFHLEKIMLGMGCFYGVRHGTVSADVVWPNRSITLSPFENQQWNQFPDATGVILKSVYPESPSIALKIRNRNNLSATQVDLETRDRVWDPSQQALLDKLKQTTGKSSWIEAGVVYFSPGCKLVLTVGA
ncbi:MAG: hypothetical protein UV66_C0005G0005 [Candidatus Woesebacteria bacterium GW2011_GWA1_43_12]|uniref:Uncharacterized protein n=1 Tax=Candidatus Woesebacteria bacterium GW2011_GWA1_43_12 TaxID=1618557 RepID=A0A0G1CXP0_9BACT|nr:MAG: hypothetical protein UV66_C0005G0005 [Candidatus Woesebacteria bacterium GW2011_GWA1_43_12]